MFVDVSLVAVVGLAVWMTGPRVSSLGAGLIPVLSLFSPVVVAIIVFSLLSAPALTGRNPSRKPSQSRKPKAIWRFGTLSPRRAVSAPIERRCWRWPKAGSND